MRPFPLLCAAVFLVGVPASHGQNFSVSPCPEHDINHFWSGSKPQACEVRSILLPVEGDAINVRARNGGITIVGEDRRDIALEVKVTATGDSRSDAQARLHEVHIATRGTIEAQGPEAGDRDGSRWSASFRLRVPRRIVANLHGENGGIDVTDVEGPVTADTRNGGLSLVGHFGTVHATTVNGGITVTLAGDRDHGDGITARTENGSISVRVADHFAAHLVASTVNGGVSMGLPGAVQRSHGKRIETDLNGGGPTVDLQTTNGGISLARL